MPVPLDSQTNPFLQRPQAAGLPRAAWFPESGTGEPRKRLAFTILMIYMFVEYARPMDILPLLGVIRIALLLSVALALCWFFASGKERAFSAPIYWFLAFIFWMCATAPFAVNQFMPFMLTQGTVLLFLVAVCIATFMNQPDQFRKFRALWLAVGCIYLGIRGMVGAGVAGSYFLGDENDYCLLLDMMIPLAFFPLMRKGHSKHKLFYLFCIVCALGGVVASMSRGGFVGLIMVTLYCWVVSPRKMIGVAIFGVLAVGLLAFAGSKYWGEMGTLFDEKDESRTGRIDSWKAGFRLFLHNPLGVGAGNYMYTVHGYDIELLEKNRTIAGRAAHSLYFTLLPELGVPGTIFYFAMVIAASRAGLRVLRRVRGRSDPEALLYRELALGLGGALVANLSAGAFISTLFYPHVFYIVGLLVALENTVAERVSVGEEDPSLETQPFHPFQTRPPNPFLSPNPGYSRFES